VNPILGVVDIEQDAPGGLARNCHSWIIAALMRFGAIGSRGSPAGSWWLRAQVGFAVVAPPLSEGRIGYEQVAVIAVGIACSDQTRVRAPLEFIPRLAPN
jgi:hypothetical protein